MYTYLHTVITCTPLNISIKFLSIPSLLTTCLPINPEAPKTVATTPLKEDRPPRPLLHAARSEPAFRFWV